MITLNRQKAELIFNELLEYENLQNHLLKSSRRELVTLFNKYLIGEAITSNDLSRLSNYLFYMKTYW